MDNVKERWYKPVDRIGRITLGIAIAASFLPFLTLYFQFGQLPPGGQIAAGIVAVLSTYVAYYIIEPISYFPALGTAGTYMSFLAGSIGQMRVPAALVAKNVAGVKENTQEAEIVAVCGIAGSIYTNIVVTTGTAVVGAWLLSVLPAAVTANMSAYILPALYGGVGAMLASNLMLFVPALAFMTLLNFLRGSALSFLPPWAMSIIGVLSGLAWARIAYSKLKLIK